jgi:hypothetical protein
MADKTTKKDEKKWEEDVNNTELETIELGDDGFDAQEFNRIKNIVARKVNQADELKKKMREISESMKNVLINDSQLSEEEEKAKEVKLAVQKRKKDLNQSPEVKNLQLKMQEVKEELKDIEDSLSNQLLRMYQLTGVTEFETDGGEVREFAIKAKVKAKRG